MPRHCPKCNSLMEYMESDPDVGISGHVFECTNEKCGEIIPAEDHGDDEYD
jgi:transcription initiation factor IIE alpha subunit